MPSVLTEIPRRQASKYGSRTALTYYANSTSAPIDTSWERFATSIDRCAAALATLGLEPGATIAILSANRPEMLITDFAAYANACIPVSIYSSASPEQVQYIVNDSRATVLLTGSEEHYRTACQLAQHLHGLRIIIACHDNAPNNQMVPGTGVRTITFRHLLDIGRNPSADIAAKLQQRRHAVRPDTTATLIYTSGTSGEPKGAILTHGCFDAAMRMHHQRLTSLSDADTSVCFLPLTHIFEKAWSYFCLDTGIAITINGDPRDIDKVLPLAKPTCLCTVPRFWEKVHEAIQEKILAMPRLKRIMVKRALTIGARRNLHYARHNKPVPRILAMKYSFYNRHVLAPLRNRIGLPNPNLLPTAGAPISANLVTFLRSCGLPIVVGYGLSETTATVTCFPYHDYIIGTVGTTMPELQVKIGPDDEILVKGPTVMSGYHNKPLETRQAFTDDRWLRTGDAGHFDSHGQLILTDRIKDMFKTSNGKYIAPQMLETRLGEDRFIDQVAIIGESRKYVTALIIPAFQALRDYAHKKHIAFRNNADLIRNTTIRAMIERRIERLQAGMAGFEKVKKFVLLPTAFSIENGELTNTLKLRRATICAHYAPQIEAMYRN